MAEQFDDVAGNESSASPSSSSPQGRSGGSSTKITTYTGSVAQTRWGPVQVKITVQDGKLTKVTILQQPSGNPRDAEINDHALPILIDESLKRAERQDRHGQRCDGDQRGLSCNRCKPPSTRLSAAKARWGPVQVKITVQGRKSHVGGPQHRHGESDDDD